MNLEQANTLAIDFLKKAAGYPMLQLHAINRVGELWSCIYEVRLRIKEERVEVLIGEERIMGFRRLKEDICRRKSKK